MPFCSRTGLVRCLRCSNRLSPAPHTEARQPQKLLVRLAGIRGASVTARQICARGYACSGTDGPCALAAVVGCRLHHIHRRANLKSCSDGSLTPKERPVTARQICARVHACSGAAGPCARAAVVGLVLQHKQVRTCSGASLYHCKHPCHGNQSVFKAC